MAPHFIGLLINDLTKSQEYSVVVSPFFLLGVDDDLACTIYISIYIYIYI